MENRSFSSAMWLRNECLNLSKDEKHVDGKPFDYVAYMYLLYIRRKLRDVAMNQC